jgi:hypothetical protein
MPVNLSFLSLSHMHFFKIRASDVPKYKIKKQIRFFFESRMKYCIHAGTWNKLHNRLPTSASNSVPSLAILTSLFSLSWFLRCVVCRNGIRFSDSHSISNDFCSPSGMLDTPPLNSAVESSGSSISQKILPRHSSSMMRPAGIKPAAGVLRIGGLAAADINSVPGSVGVEVTIGAASYSGGEVMRAYPKYSRDLLTEKIR